MEKDLEQNRLYCESRHEKDATFWTVEWTHSQIPQSTIRGDRRTSETAPPTDGVFRERRDTIERMIASGNWTGAHRTSSRHHLWKENGCRWIGAYRAPEKKTVCNGCFWGVANICGMTAVHRWTRASRESQSTIRVLGEITSLCHPLSDW